MSLIRVERWEFSTCQEAIEAAEWLEKDAAYLRREAAKYKPGWRADFMIPRILSNAQNIEKLAAELRCKVANQSETLRDWEDTAKNWEDV
jgi:hypothetical protein